MAGIPRLAVFDKFIQSARAFCAANPDTEARMKKIRILLEALVSEPSLREHAKTWPSTEGHKNLLLYEDPDYGFVVNAVVRTPGREGRVHDHAHAWTAYGVLDGMERLERYRRKCRSRCREDLIRPSPKTRVTSRARAKKGGVS